MKITVLIPTFRRVPDLTRCLEALAEQRRPADEVVVTVRDIDADTDAYLAVGLSAAVRSLPLRVIKVTTPGVVAAMNAGLAAATGDVIALTDDDTAPYPDWLERIEAHFRSDPRVGGVGGRDHQASQAADREPVGLVQWYGRTIGNHHSGYLPARDVDFLKGANCAYRAAPLKAVAFDERLLGKGAQVNWELGVGLKMRRAGWRLIYDPAVALDHFIAPRHDDDLFHRGIFSGEPHHNATHNGTLMLWDYFSGPRRAVYLLWMFLIGTRGEPGALHFLLQMARRDRLGWARFRHTMLGRVAAIRTASRTPAGAVRRAPGPPSAADVAALAAETAGPDTVSPGGIRA